MSAVRRSRAFLLTVAIAGCGGRPGVVLAPAPVEPALDTTALATTLFLIGDAGHVGPGDRVIAELTRQGQAARRGATIVFLGDNVYPAGIPDETSASYPEARRRLYAQAKLAETTGLRVIFVPGNHDWDRQGEAGWAAVQRQDRLLRRFADSTGSQVELQPRAGCPGPTVTPIGARVRLVAIDTPWWLHGKARPGREPPGTPRSDCAIDTEAGVLDSLRQIYRTTDGRMTVTVGHHPLVSHGEHGGFHPRIQYLLPVVPTPIARWAWLPIGWIYPLARRLVGNPQDLAGRANRTMREAIEGTFSDRAPFIYAAGHDHSLEVIRRGPNRFYLVSGSGTEEHQTAVGSGDSTAFSSSRPGFMRLDVFVDGRVRVGVTAIDEARQPREIYQAWLKQ